MTAADVLAELARARGRIAPVEKLLRGRGHVEPANDLRSLMSTLELTHEPVRIAAHAVDRLRERANKLQLKAQPFAAAQLVAILRDLASVADAELVDTAVGVPVIDDDMVDTNTIVVDEPNDA